MTISQYFKKIERSFFICLFFKALAIGLNGKCLYLAYIISLVTPLIVSSPLVN